jgi:hypothetical protein
MARVVCSVLVVRCFLYRRPSFNFCCTCPYTYTYTHALRKESKQFLLRAPLALLLGSLLSLRGRQLVVLALAPVQKPIQAQQRGCKHDAADEDAAAPLRLPAPGEGPEAHRCDLTSEDWKEAPLCSWGASPVCLGCVGARCESRGGQRKQSCCQIIALYFWPGQTGVRWEEGAACLPA